MKNEEPINLPEGVTMYEAPKAGKELFIMDPKKSLEECRSNPKIQRAVFEGRLCSLALIPEDASR